MFALKRSNSSTALTAEINDAIQWIDGDVLDIASLEDSMQGMDYVFHSAAVVSFNPRHYDEMMEINVQGTANVAEIARLNEVKKLIHVSSIAALGRREKLDHIDEETEWQSSSWNTKYAVSKQLSEMEVWRASAEGLKIAIVNPSVILGSAFWEKGTGRFFKIVWNGLRLYPTGSTGFVDVRDVVEAMVRLMESDVKEERIVLNGENLPYKFIFDRIADQIGKPRAKIKVTKFLREVAWRVDSLLNIIFGKAPRVTRETARNSSRNVTFGNQKSKDLLDMEYRPIEKTIDEMAVQFLEASKKNFKPVYMDF